MEILVSRIKSNSDQTLASITIDGRWECFGLEDEYRLVKVASETRIPAGKYKIGLRNEGGFHTKYSRLYPDFHQGMLQVLNVPNFEFILIHKGNTDEDTAGCLIIGQNATGGNELSISASELAYKAFYKKVIAAAKAGILTIVYVDLDR